jgi:ABC-type lipoprotein release transport system permease subunit
MRFRVLLKLALRSVGRNARRSALTAAAMVIGLALLIFSRSLAEGAHEQWVTSAVRMGTGHVAIQAPDYLESGKLEHRIGVKAYPRALDAVEAVAGERVVAHAPRLTVNGLASSASSALPVRVEGVDPDRERIFSDLDEKVVDGRYLQSDDRLHAYVGVELARRLGLKVGTRFVLTAQSASGDVEGQLVRVAGIFKSAVPEMDAGLIHIPLETAREWLGTPGAVTTYAVLLTSSRDTDGVVEELHDRLSGDDLRVLGWRDTSPELDAALRMDDYGDYVFHAILFAIVALAIMNAVMMSVLGRRREFGVLQALGLTGAQTGWVVFGEGLFLTAASGVVGMGLGFLFTWGFFRDGIDFSGLVENESAWASAGGIVDPVIVPTFHSSQVLLSLYFMLIIGTLASIYPAMRASKLDVAEAMKFDQ